VSRRLPLVVRLVPLALVAVGCHGKSEPPPPPAPKATPSAKPLDRLAPGELAQGPNEVFGFMVPRSMRIRGAFLEVAYVEGNVTPEALANYVRERVDTDHVEIGAATTLFPRVHIKHGAPDHIYDFEVSPGQGNLSELVIRDVTPRPPNPPGMSDEERWRQAGYRPDGTPIDPNQLK
jgi:hypothetical protein